jgi:tetratricopeptide (TPR) repeat protein
MHMKNPCLKHSFVAPVFLAAVVAVSVRAATAAEPFIDTTGSAALVKGDFQGALDILERSAAADTLFSRFKQAVAHYQLKHLDRALVLFQQCASPSFSLRSVALEYTADIGIQRGRYSDAAQTYLSALRDTLPEKVKKRLVDKLSSLTKEDPFIVAAFPELAGLAAQQQAIAEPRAAADSVGPLLDSLLSQKRWAEADSVLSLSLDTTASDRTCGLVGRIRGHSLADSALSTRLLFMLARGASACKWYGAADSLLSRAEQRTDFMSTVGKNERLLLRGFVNYYRARHTAAVRDLSDYQTAYGPTPEVVLALGRACRALGKDTQSVYWYNRFVALYPKNTNTPDVYWYMAWKAEEDGSYGRAAGLYQKIASMKKSAGRDDDAYFRKGLCYYKAGQFQRACSTLTSFAALFQDSPLSNAAAYWKAKCVLALGRPADAARLFSAVVGLSPTDYYSYRAREMLVLMGDSAQGPSLDTTLDMPATRRWIDSLSNAQPQPMSAVDSLSYQRGTLLVFAGQCGSARMFLDGLEIRYPTNLSLQFDLALLYRFSNNPALSYRTARRLAWRIPAAARLRMPQPLYDLLYPFPYSDIVQNEAAKSSIDPFLVASVIRQESTFDPDVVSRSGAIGLMQIMPFTGKTIAKQLDEPFVLDSLYRPKTNIRYGAFYLKVLLNQFGGNMVLALASYNGGPPRANEWYAKNKRKTFDLFIEDIGFTETRGYVKKVLANYWTYRRFAAHYGPW